MAFTLQKILLFGLIIFGVNAVPQYHHQGYHKMSAQRMDYMNKFDHMANMQHQQDFHHNKLFSPYPYSRSIHKINQQDMSYPRMNNQIMMGYKPPEGIHYSQQDPAYSEEYMRNPQGFDKSHQKVIYNDQMYNEKQHGPLHYTNQADGSNVLHGMANKQQNYSPAASVSHVKFNGMGTMYEWGNNY